MRIQRIADAADPRLDDFRNLTDSALRRSRESDEGLYIAESENVIIRALEAGHRPRAVLAQEKWLPDLSGFALAADVPVYAVSATVAEALTGYAVHRGLLAAMHRPALRDPVSLVADAQLVLVLDDIADPTNVGAAFRAAAGLGADAVIVTERCADPLYRRSVRVSMGTVFQVPWTRWSDDTRGRVQLREAGFRVAALALSPGATPLEAYAARRPARVALVLGAEGEGLSAPTLAEVDDIVTIPMAGGVDSLNVAAAAAVALWELRQR